MPTIRIVDDEPKIVSSLPGALGREGDRVEGAASPAAARARLEEAFDFVLLDVWFPDGNGIALLKEILAATPDTRVIMMSGHATIDAAVEATRAGAYDFLEKPVSLERLLILLRNAANARSLESENRRLRAPWAVPIVGGSAAIGKLAGEIALAAPTAARCSWTRWASCPRAPRPSCCACSRKASCHASAATAPSGWMCA